MKLLSLFGALKLSLCTKVVNIHNNPLCNIISLPYKYDMNAVYSIVAEVA